ncbi:hypothetical protein ADL03_15345 [Nocardia sp. NRRL S-836]|nr:hypothetical protein ADL03_15345 [Nocardia sp. NRRL S-836]
MRPGAARTGRRPDRAVARRRVLAGVARGTSCLLGVIAVAVLCWTVEVAAALPARLVADAPWPLTRSMAALAGVLAVVHLRGLGGRWAWWSRLALWLTAMAAGVELLLRGWHVLGALAVVVAAASVMDVAALAVDPARLFHHTERPRDKVTGSTPPHATTSSCAAP